jgi:hypothetical protein
VLDYPRLIIGQRTVIGMLSKERNVFILCFLLELGCEPAKLLRNGRSHGSAHELASLLRKKLLGWHSNFSNNFKENFNN